MSAIGDSGCWLRQLRGDSVGSVPSPPNVPPNVAQIEPTPYDHSPNVRFHRTRSFSRPPACLSDPPRPSGGAHRHRVPAPRVRRSDGLRDASRIQSGGSMWRHTILLAVSYGPENIWHGLELTFSGRYEEHTLPARLLRFLHALVRGTALLRITRATFADLPSTVPLFYLPSSIQLLVLALCSRRKEAQ